VSLETRFSKIRSEETNFGNFMADLCRMHAQTDITIINSGTIRSDCVIPKGILRLREIKNILPITDKLVTIEITGEQLIRALECGVSRYPSLEGRFPCVSGVSFVFDAKEDPYKRVLRDSVKIGGFAVQLEKKYTLSCKAFIAQGKDGYDVLGHCKKLVYDELSDELESILLKFFDLANDKDMEADIDRKFHLEDQTMPHLITVLSQDGKDNMSPRNIPNAPKILRRKSSEMKRFTKKLQFLDLMSNAVIIDGHYYIEICPKLDDRIKILNSGSVSI